MTIEPSHLPTTYPENDAPLTLAHTLAFTCPSVLFPGFRRTGCCWFQHDTGLLLVARALLLTPRRWSEESLHFPVRFSHFNEEDNDESHT